MENSPENIEPDAPIDDARGVDPAAGVGEPATAEDTVDESAEDVVGDAAEDTVEDAEDVDLKKARRDAAKYRQRAKDTEKKLEEANATIEELQANLRTACRETVATKHDFSDELMDFVTGDTLEEMEASAQKLRDAIRRDKAPMGLMSPSVVKLGTSLEESSSTTASWANALKPNDW